MIHVFKVRALPPSPLPGALYFVNASDDETFTDAYLTSKTGVPKAIGNTEMIQDLIDANQEEVAPLIVADITERNQLVHTQPRFVFVADASMDNQVGSGPALYLWDVETEMYQLMPTGSIGGSVIDGGNF